MQKVLQALATARLFIKSHPLKKDGRNKYSDYEYFTPEMVSKLVNEACNEVNLICVFNLKQDALSLYGEVVTTDLESGESLITEIRTARPNITATNETQQMGGALTYAKRYALMSLFDIEDNNSDFDSQDNTKQTSAAPAKAQAANDDKPWLNKATKAGIITDEWKKVTTALSSGNYTMDQVYSKFKVNKALLAELQGIINSVVSGPATDFEETPF